MGRRNRPKRNSWEEDDDDGEIDRAEMEWLMHRQTSANKRRRPAENETNSIPDDVNTKDKNNHESQTDIAANGSPQIAPKNDANSPEKDKIERMKLKKQRQKERRKEKKAKTAKAAEAIQQSRQESEKAIQNKKKQEQERKKKIKQQNQSSSQQQGFTTLAKGVQYQDLIVGKGPPVQHRKKVRVSYTLRAKSHTTGKILDSSANFGFRLGKGEVIRGWDIGLQDMRVGGVRRLVVPAAAGYGHNKDVGAGRGADLYFQIDLLHVAP